MAVSHGSMFCPVREIFQPYTPTSPTATPQWSWTSRSAPWVQFCTEVSNQQTRECASPSHTSPSLHSSPADTCVWQLNEERQMICPLQLFSIWQDPGLSATSALRSDVMRCLERPEVIIIFKMVKYLPHLVQGSGFSNIQRWWVMLYLLGIIVLCFVEEIPAILLACVSFNHLPAKNNDIKKRVPSQEVHY